jgi:hypothetical protein
MTCAKNNPAALRYIVMLMGLYLHLGPFSRHVVASIERRMAEIAAPPPMAFDPGPDAVRLG